MHESQAKSSNDRAKGQSATQAKPAAAATTLSPARERVAFQLATGTPEGDSERQADSAAAAVVGNAGASSPVALKSAPFGVIVDDGGDTTTVQVHRTDFMNSLAADIERVANEKLAAIGRTAHDCPYLAQYLAIYRTRSAASIEGVIQRYAKPTAITVEGLQSAVLTRVASAVDGWISSAGRKLDVPQGAASDAGSAQSATTPPVVQRKAVDGATDAASREGPSAVRAQLASGRPIDGGVRSRMERGFGIGFGDVNVHTDPNAAGLARSYAARAFTVGTDIAFAEGAYKPGTTAGDLLIAHELAHVVQQRGVSPSQPAPTEGEATNDLRLEDEANLAAGSLLLREHANAQERALLPDMSVLQRGGLRLSRCGPTETVPELTKLSAKVEWINAVLAGDTTSFRPKNGGQFDIREKDRAIVDMLGTLSVDEFIDIQSRISMSKVFDEMDDFHKVRIGTFGPIVGTLRDVLNEARADYLSTMTRERGANEGQVIGHWMFSNMFDNDIADVLTRLGERQHLHNTVDDMPAVLALLKNLGIDRSQYHDRGWKVGDIGRGLKNAVNSFLGSSEMAKSGKGSNYMSEDMELPAPYAKAMGDTMMAEFDAAFTPSNIVFGSIDYIAFGIPGSVVGAVKGTISGVGDLTEGHVESGVEKLTGPVIMVIGFALGVRAFRKNARMVALMELTSEGQAALAQLRASIGQAGIDRVAKYVKADAEAAFFTREQGLAGIEALEKAGGNVTKARGLIGTNVARLGGLLTTNTISGLSLATQQALATLPDALLKALAGVDAATLDSLAQMLRETSPAMRARFLELAGKDPAAFGDLLRTQQVAALDALRTGPFADVAELAKNVGKTGERMRFPVERDGQILYESIDPKNPPPGWKFRDKVTKRGNTTTIRTDVESPDGSKGFFERRFNPATGELEMLEAFLRENEGAPKIPNAVPGGVALRKGSGTPTVAYASLRQLRIWNVAMGAVRKIFMRQIENFASIVRLEWIRRNFPTRALDLAVADTESVGYASTIAEQSGSRVTGVRLTGGKTQPIGNLMATYEADAAKVSEVARQRVAGEHDAILKQYGFDRATPMLTNFDIELGLEPIPATPKPSIEGKP